MTFDQYRQDELHKLMMADAAKVRNLVKRRDGQAGWAARAIFGSSSVERRRQRVVDLFEQGHTTRDIAKIVGINRNTVKSDLLQMRDNAKVEKPKEDQISAAEQTAKEQNQAIVRLRKSGLTYREIANSIGIGIGAVSNRINVMRSKGVDV